MNQIARWRPERRCVTALLEVAPEHKCQERTVPWPYRGQFPLWSGESLTWSGKVSLLHCQLYLQFAVSRLCFYTVVEFHLCSTLLFSL